MNDLTYGQLKRRILDCLFEHEISEGEIVHLDDGKNTVMARMVNTVNSCLVRMYESFSFSRRKARLSLKEDTERSGFVSAVLPDDFYRFDDVLLSSFSGDEFFVSDGKVYFERGICSAPGMSELYYRIKPQNVCEDTEDDFVFDLSPLCFEVLVCMCAMELCGANESALYTRLYYKYGDLCQGLCEPLPTARKNSFYHAPTKKRWL